MDAPTESTRCRSCLITQPVEHFRLRSRSTGQRMSQCRTCHNEAERIRRAGKRHDTLNSRLGSAQSAINREDDDRRVRRLCLNLIDHFGGVDRLAQQWVAHLDYASRTEPGSRRVLNSMMAIFRLLRAQETTRRPYKDMTDAELMREMLGLRAESGRSA